MGSQGGSCRFGLGCLARCRSQLHTSTSLRLLFLQQDHKSFKTTPIAAQLSGLERSGSCPIESSRIPGAPTYQGGPSLRPVDAFISESSVLAFCRFSGLYNIFRCHNCQVPQHAIEFLLHRSCSCLEILVALKCLRKCIRWHAIPLSPVPFIIHLIFIIFEIPTLPSPSISSQLLLKKISKSLLSISNYNGRRSHSREKPQAPQVPQPFSLTTITYTFIDYGRFWLYRIQDSDPSS